MLKQILCLCFIGFAAGALRIRDVKTPPTWSKTYSVKGLLLIPYAELKEPFYAWYDEPNKKSRIDYYGGMVKTYQLQSAPGLPQGASLKVAPVTTEKVQNKMTCLQTNGSEEYSIKPQSVLPDLSNFKYVGMETIGDDETQKWRLVVTIADKDNKYTMWIKYRKNLRGESVPIPVRYELRGYNSLQNSHYDHYYMEYEDFSVDAVTPDIFAIDLQKCISFPGPGIDHLYTFNPMKEFVYPVMDDHVDSEFERFKNKHNKEYENHVEHTKRKNIFRQNLRYIHSKNRAHLGFSLGVNALADRLDVELRALRGRRATVADNGADPFPYNLQDGSLRADRIPDEYDWRLYGAVAPVKDQSVCGSCWSFGSTGAVEGAYFLHNGGHMVRLSQQALVDCSWGYGNNGCDGGEDFRSYQWIMKHGGLPTEEDYGGYLGQDGYCHVDNVTLVAPVKGYVNVTANNKEALKLAIFKHGPISVAIDASRPTFTFYSHGLYYDPDCHNDNAGLDHAVLAVGYGKLNGEDYWLVKNSWSNYWGNDGYVLMSAKNNNCGVQTNPTYVYF